MTDVEEEYTEPDYTYVIGKEPTNLQRRMAEWIRSEEVGYDPTTAKTKLEAFEEGVRIAVAHRMSYQASAHNREATALEREERAAYVEQVRAEREAAKEAKAAEREAAAAAKAAAKEEAPVEAPAAPAKPAKAARPAKAAKAAPAKAAPAAPAATAPAAGRPAPRRAPARRAAPAAASTPQADAPF